MSLRKISPNDSVPGSPDVLLLQVQLCVHVQPGPPDTYEFLECTTETYIEEIKCKIEFLGKQSGEYSVKADMLELWFMNEECKNGKQLKDYSICHDWIMQVRC